MGCQKGSFPEPPPLSLSLCAVTEMDVSRISVLPANRLPVETYLASGQGGIDRALSMIRDALHREEKVFWVCSRIGEDEGGDMTLPVTSAMDR